MSMEGRVAIITGASRGIGRSIALKLASEGVAVVLAAKTLDEKDDVPGSIVTVAEEVRALGGRALPVQTDVRDEAAIENMVAKAAEAFGRVDILINNAGALWWFPVSETPAKRFDLMMGVNVRASFLAARAVLPYMKKNKWGHIINMSPPIEFDVLPGKVGYFISKYGMTMLTMGLSKEVARDNIAVHSLWPVTLVESMATIHFGLGGPKMWRKPEILADATWAVVTKDPKFQTGKVLLDEEVLAAEGITDFSAYNCTPDGEPMRIVWDRSGKKG